MNEERFRLFKSYLFFFACAGVSFLIAIVGDSMGALWIQIVGTILMAFFIFCCFLIYINIGIVTIQGFFRSIVSGLNHFINLFKKRD